MCFPRPIPVHVVESGKILVKVSYQHAHNFTLLHKTQAQ